MSEHERENLKNELQHWQVHLERDPLTTQHVLNRIASGRGSDQRRQRPFQTTRWLIGAGIAAMLAFAAVYITGQRNEIHQIQDNQYQVIIDPVTRANLHRDNLQNDQLLEQLAWMQNRLNLSQTQFLQLVDLHRNYSETFDALYDQLVSLEAEYEQFEFLRKNNEMVDFIALYEVLNTRKQTEDKAHKASRELISRVSSILNPSQKTAYLSLIKPVLKPNA